MVAIRKIELRNDLDIASNILSEAFSKDPLFQMVFQPFKRQEKIKHFFKFLLRSNLLLQNEVFLATVNGEIAGVCSFSYPKRKTQITFNIPFLFDTCHLIFLIGIRPFLTLNRYFSLIRETQKPDLYYLNFIGVSTKYKGRGVAKKLIDFVHYIVASDPETSAIGLDTENPDNVTYYQKYGYHITEQKLLKSLAIYCMRKNFYNP